MTELEKEIGEILKNDIKIFHLVSEQPVQLGVDISKATPKLKDLIQSYCQKQKEICLDTVKTHGKLSDNSVLVNLLKNAPLATEGK